MSVLGHLTDCATNAVLSPSEKESITTSITTLSYRLSLYFEKQISEKIRFGSSTRDTILPRGIDAHSDIDYMIVFGDSSSKPQTYLDRLRRFVESYYSRSEISQSHPTIKLSLNHIHFDLVPAISGYSNNLYQIPNTTGYSDWMQTNPNDFNSRLTQSNMSHKYLIKPLVRLMKYWNARNEQYVFDSYSLEQHIVNHAWFGNNLRDYLFAYVRQMSLGWSDAQWRKDRVERAKQIVTNTEQYETQGYPALAEAEIAKLLPKYW